MVYALPEHDHPAAFMVTQPAVAAPGFPNPKSICASDRATRKLMRYRISPPQWVSLKCWIMFRVCGTRDAKNKTIADELFLVIEISPIYNAESDSVS